MTIILIATSNLNKSSVKISEKIMLNVDKLTVLLKKVKKEELKFFKKSFILQFRPTKCQRHP